jgi:glycosyltransferase involved in cell wall biosynthesis
VQANFSSKVIAVIPAYNEERYIGSVVLKTRQYVDEVLVVDDGSLDATADIASAAGAKVIRLETNSGKGMALNTGFEAARAMQPKVVVTLDGDWQHCPEQLERVIAPVLKGEADVVIGSRYLEKTSDVPVQRVLGHMGFGLLINSTSGVSVTDSQSGFRAFSTVALESFTFSSSSFSVESEMQYLAADFQLRVVEVPITIRYVDKPKRSVIRHGLIVLDGVLRLIGQHRPLLWFGMPAFICLLIGAVAALYATHQFNSANTLELGMILAAVILLFIGFLALFTGIVLHSMRALKLELRSIIR